MGSMLTFDNARLIANLRALEPELRRKAVGTALKQGAEPIRAAMQANAPHGPDAPHIKDHIVVKTVTSIDGVKLGEAEQAVAVGPEKAYFYGYFFERGTIKMSARPWARPAFDTNQGEALEIIGRELWSGMPSPSTV